MSVELKVGQVWCHASTQTEWLIVGIQTDGTSILREARRLINTVVWGTAFNLQQHISNYTLVSEWDGKLRPGQQWAWKSGSRWHAFTLNHLCRPKFSDGLLSYEESQLLADCRTHLQQAHESLMYLGEGEPEEPPMEEAAVDDVGRLDDISVYREIMSAFLDANFKNKGEHNMEKLKITEVVLEEIKPSTLKARLEVLANIFGYTGEEVDGKLYFLTPEKLVGEFEVTPESITELFRKHITEGDQKVINFAIERGILTGGRFVVKQ